MLPILVPNIGFKKFSEIKPNQGILHVVAPNGASFWSKTSFMRYCPSKIYPLWKLATWLNGIEADLDSLEEIHKTRNANFENMKADKMFNETYTGIIYKLHI